MSGIKGRTGRTEGYDNILYIPEELEARNERGVTVAAGTVYDYKQNEFQENINDRLIKNNNSPIYIIKPNIDFEYNGNTYRLTKGYIDQKDVYDDDTLLRESGYTNDEYTIMYNNARAVEAAIKYAYENGYGGVKFEKGEYCFSPERPENTPNYCYPIIKIYNLSHFDIDFGGSTFYNLVDSEHLSPYYNKANDSDPSYKTWSFLFFISNSEFVTIHDGTFIGDRTVRKWIGTEHIIEQTYGIVVGGFCRFINIKNIEAASFMGDGIAWFLYYYDGTNLSYEQKKASNLTKINAYRGKFYYVKTGGDVVIQQESTNIDNCAISEIISLDSLYDATNAVGTYKKFKDERIFFLGRSGHPFITDDNSTNKLSNVYPDIDILTYDDEDDENPIRIVKAHYLQNFKLLPNETRIRLQFYHEDLLCEDLGYIDEYDNDPTNFKGALVKETVNGVERYYVQKGLAVIEGRSHNVIIENCYIHDSHRGGFTGCAYNLTVRNCKFVRSNPIPEDRTGEPLYYYEDGKYRSTRYHIDIEDVPSWGINIENNVFINYGATPDISTGGVLFPAGIGLTVKRNYFDGATLSVCECGDTIITDNTLYSLRIDEDRYLIDGTLRYKYSDVGSGALHAKRCILLSNNIINDITLRFLYLRNTTLKSSGNIYNKATFIYGRNVGTNTSIVDDSDLDTSFISDNIKLNFVPTGVYGYTFNHRIPLNLFTNCIFDVTIEPENTPNVTIFIVNIKNSVCVIKNNIFRNLKLRLSEELASLCKGTVFIEDCEFINSYFIPTISPDTSVTLKNIEHLDFSGDITPSKLHTPDSPDGYRLIVENCTIPNKLRFTLYIYKVDATFKRCNFDYSKNNALFTINHPSVVTDDSTNPATTGPMQDVLQPDVHLIDCDNIDGKLLRLWNNNSKTWNDVNISTILYIGDFVYDEASKDLRNEPVALTQDTELSAKFNRYYDVSGSYTLTIILPPKDVNTSKISYFVVHKAAGSDVSFSVPEISNPPTINESEDIDSLTTEDCEISVLWNGSAWYITVVKF